MDKENFINILQSEQDFQKHFTAIENVLGKYCTLYESDVYQAHGKLFDTILKSVLKEWAIDLICQFLYESPVAKVGDTTVTLWEEHFSKEHPLQLFSGDDVVFEITDLDSLFEYINDNEGWLM